VSEDTSSALHCDTVFNIHSLTKSQNLLLKHNMQPYATQGLVNKVDRDTFFNQLYMSLTD